VSEHLSNAALATLPAQIQRPVYDRARLGNGIVHLGPGAFHRAHQAQAVDDLLARDPRWGILGVSLHSAGVRDALNPQDGLYTLALLDEDVRFRIIGAITNVLVAPENPEAVLQRLSAPETEIVTLTITEKGYCLGSDGALDLNNSDIKADLEHRGAPKSAIAYLAEAARRRRASGAKPLVVISCDNLVANGQKLRDAVAAFARERDPDLAKYIAGEMVFPGTMVDSITPATDDALRARVAQAIGVQDRWPIQREAFTQWVMETHDHKGGPDWASAGVTLTSDVSAFERAKLRILNASHSGLAYMGLLRGHETVYEAVNDPDLKAFVRGLMAEDVSPGLKLPADFDLAAYREAVLKRFANPEIRHLLSQIAWDGSQKLPNRAFGIVTEAVAAGRPIDRPCAILAAWFVFLRGKARSGDKLVDPLAPLLLETAGRCTGDPAHDVGLFLGMETVFPRAFAIDESIRRGLVGAYERLSRQT